MPYQLWIRAGGPIRVAITERGDDATRVLGYIVKNGSDRFAIEGDLSGRDFEFATQAAKALAGPNLPETDEPISN
jgi:hypothetical protein